MGFTKVIEKSLRPTERSSPHGEAAEAVGGRMELGALGWGLFLFVSTFLLSSMRRSLVCLPWLEMSPVWSAAQCLKRAISWITYIGPVVPQTHHHCEFTDLLTQEKDPRYCVPKGKCWLLPTPSHSTQLNHFLISKPIAVFTYIKLNHMKLPLFNVLTTKMAVSYSSTYHVCYLDVYVCFCRQWDGTTSWFIFESTSLSWVPDIE